MQGRSFNWLAWILVPIAIFAMAVGALWLYMGATAKPLHPDSQAVPSEMSSAPSAKWTGAIEQSRQIVRSALAEQNLPGLSVAVGTGGDLVWAEGFGFADLDSKTPVRPNHRFRIGTASIMLTSAAAGLLLEQGKLKLGDTIQTYVPEYPQAQWPVTLRHLMGHLSGLINDGGDEGPLFSEQCERPVEALKHFADLPLRFEPGTKYQYSSYGWILVSAAVEAAAKQPFLAFLKEQVFEPLGMRDTLADSTTAPPDPNVVTFYFPRFAASPKYGYHDMRPLNYSCYAGSSVFLSTPSDLVRFGMAIHAGKLLKPDTVKLLQATQHIASGAETGYGLGWDIENVTLASKQTRVVGHDGDTLGGMVATLITLPDRGLAVSLLSNISYTDTFSLATRIAEAFMSQESRPPSP